MKVHKQLVGFKEWTGVSRMIFLVHVLLFSVVQCSDNCTIVLAPAGICSSVPACNAVSALEHCSSIGIRGVYWEMRLMWIKLR
jgi:hypothetical protein